MTQAPTQPAVPYGTAHHSTREFDYRGDNDLQQFTADASSLGWAPGYWAPFVLLTSGRTGCSRLFYPLGWPEAYDGQAREYTDGHGLTMLIFND